MEKEKTVRSERRGVVRRGRYNMDFDLKKGDPYGIVQKACDHIDALKKREADSEM